MYDIYGKKEREQLYIKLESGVAWKSSLKFLQDMVAENRQLQKRVFHSSKGPKKES